MNTKQITILGVGNYLFTDEGVGIRVIEKLEKEYQFPEHVVPVDGGVLGVHLMGVISAADHLIVVDAIRNKHAPGTLYRLAGEQIPARILAKNSLHQVDLLEALTLVKAIDRSPETVIVGVEPEDIETMGLTLTTTVEAKMEDLTKMVLVELDRLGVSYTKRETIN